MLIEFEFFEKYERENGSEEREMTTLIIYGFC